MSNYPKPSFVISQSNFSIVWFGATNHFLVVQDILEVFFNGAMLQNDSDYQDTLEGLIETCPEIKDLFEVISIDNSNSLTNNTQVKNFKYFPINNFQVSYLVIGKYTISVNYSSKIIQTLFEAPYSYLKTNDKKSNKELTICEKNNQLSLFSGKELIYTTSKDQFYVLQSQFANKLTEFYHFIDKPRWICAFHGCAVQKNNKTLLLLGDSGVGKSTLSALLSLSDYRFIADDLVLMDHDFKIFDNPSAVSVKEDAWTVIEGYYKAFSDIKASEKTKGKTKMKFLPLHALQNNAPKSFNLDAIVWVNYSKNQTNHLCCLDKKEALSRLIPDTWIYPKEASAKAFTHWFIDKKTYHLDYSDFKTAKRLLDDQL
jgi:hypothetical protein